MLEKVLNILAAQLDMSIDEITVDSDIVRELGADSLDIIELADKFEKEFDVTVSDEEIMETKTVDDIIKYLSGYGARVRKSDSKEGKQLTIESSELPDGEKQ